MVGARSREGGECLSYGDFRRGFMEEAALEISDRC